MPQEISSMWISVRMLCDFDRLMMDFMVLGVLGGGVDDFHSSEDIFEAVGGILQEIAADKDEDEIKYNMFLFLFLNYLPL